MITCTFAVIYYMFVHHLLNNNFWILLFCHICPFYLFIKIREANDFVNFQVYRFHVFYYELSGKLLGLQVSLGVETMCKSKSKCNTTFCPLKRLIQKKQKSYLIYFVIICLSAFVSYEILMTCCWYCQVIFNGKSGRHPLLSWQSPRTYPHTLAIQTNTRPHAVVIP